MSDLTGLTGACFSGCTEAQREAIGHGSGPLLVLAGPGSGKTRVVARRVAYLIAGGVRPEEIVAITFTNKAAGEMRARVEALGAAGGVWISTFHSFCARVLRAYARDVGLRPSFTIYDTADSVATVRRAMERLEIDKSLYNPAQIAKTISGAKGRLWTPAEVRKSHRPEAETVALIYEEYETLLRAANAADFDDLLGLVVRLFREVPRARDDLGGRFRHVLVDEYQDTNCAQYVIAKHLASAHGNICATGDPDQAIYGWRGADVGNILEFERDYPEAKVVRLERNYRSTKRILKAADDLIAHNEARKAKGLWTENPEGEAVALVRTEDEKEEARAVAVAIARLIRDGVRAPRDIAVLYRVNAQSRALEAALRGEGAPYTIVAGTEFFQRKEIKDLVAYLRLIENEADDVSVGRVCNVPLRKIGEVSLGRLKAWSAGEGISLLDAMGRAEEVGLRGPGLRGIADFRRVLSELRAMPRRPVAAIVARLIDATGYEDHLQKTAANSDERIENVRELVNAAAEFDQGEPEGELRGFLEKVALISDVDTLDGSRGTVTLMTLHAAKGLEFPVVYIVGVEENLLPLGRGEDGPHDLEEERRLLFVGITRAKERVSLSFAESRARYGKRDYVKPSRFLKEIFGEDAASAFGRRLSAHLWETRRRSWPGGRSRMEPRRVRRSETEEIVYDGDLPMDELPFVPGDRVEHATHGRGEVLSVEGYGEDMRATVRFERAGVKRLMLRYAGLRKA